MSNNSGESEPRGGGRTLGRSIGGSIVGLLIALVLSAIAGLYFEFSISAPRSLGEMAGIKEILSLIDVKLDFGTTQKWRGYIGESRGNDHNIEEVLLTLKQLSKYKRVIGEYVSPETGDEFSTVGFLGGSSGVLVDLGRTFGVGAYILKPGASNSVSGAIYFGYLVATAWRNEPGGDTFIARCPFVLVSDEVAGSQHLTPAKAEQAFGFLDTPCTEFKMPMSLSAIDPQ